VADSEHALPLVVRLLGDAFELCTVPTWADALGCVEAQRPRVIVVGYHFTPSAGAFRTASARIELTPSRVTINEYLDAVKSALGCRTDARLAERLDVVQSRISHYRKGRVLPNIHMARRLASALNIPAATLISDIRKQKARRRRSLAKRYARSAKAGRRV